MVHNSPGRKPAFLRDLTPPAKGYRMIRDPETRRLHLRVMASGTASWVIVYWRSHTIGTLDNPWTYPLARAEAHRLNMLIDQGMDPHLERGAQRDAPTMLDLFDEWRTDISSTSPPKLKERSRVEYEGRIRQWIEPALGKKRVADVTFDDIERLHRQVTAHGTPWRANRVVSTASVLFRLAIKRRWRADNPCKGVEFNREEARFRFVDGNELERFFAALAQCDSATAVRVIWLLLLTGSRKSEVLRMSWAQLSPDLSVWRKPPSSTKTSRLHVVPVSAPAQQILSEIKAEAEAQAARDGKPVSPWVFPMVGAPDKPIASIRKAWTTVLRRAGIEDLRLHDLRHTAASILVSAGVGLPLIGRLLGHARSRTTERYAHVALDPLRVQVDRLADILTAAKTGRTAKVVELPGRKTG